ncbi:MOLPALP family lipoprotein [Entomoplasma freundtii]|uniref:MOLPALP family lipoprotein n=1 Tax=Entomoplasma freundtii TaxID=74700 RepID=A0A2K8NUF1_9MOLU|nr:MOLPALP family lipoprotein [Entomoplasma freundtii]ATZ16391.1 MOLPALP family lipoprotein [Entomoplasma freundtii]TDY56570.1 MOLPALP family lipoprotein [Entomoplasma freundtii]
MKKLLSILGALSVVASTASVTSCEYSKLVKSSLENKVRNYIAISSLLARSAVLSQRSDQKAMGGEGLSLKASSQYLYGQSIKNYFTESELPTGGANNTVREMLGSMFNFGSSNSDVYTVKSGREGDPFESNLALEDNVDTGRQSQDSIIKTLGPISGVVSLLFGNNFSAEMQASAINNTLGAVLDVVGNAVTENDGALIGKVLNFIRLKDAGEEFPQGDYIFKTFSDSLKEDDLPNIESMTFNDVFAVRYINAWTGLGQILYSGVDKPNGKTWTEYLDNIKAQNSKPDGRNAEAVANATIYSKDFKDFKVVFNSRLINGIIDILKFLRTLTVFFNYVDENSRAVNSIKANEDYNNLFSTTETNGIFLAKALKVNYLNPSQVIKEGQESASITQWVQLSDNSYYQTFNLQGFLRYIQNIFSFDPQDPHGYAFARILSLIFSAPTKDDGKSQDTTVMTLPFDGLIEPLLTKLLTLIPGFPDIPSFIIGYALATFRTTLGNSTPAWDSGPAAVFSLRQLLNTAAGFLKGNPSIQNLLYQLVNLMDVEKKENKPLFESNWGNPIWGIYGNQLIPIVLKALVDNNVANISKDLMNNLENLTKLLTTKIGDLLKGFGLDISTLPMFLYGIKGLTITDLINTVATEFDVQRNARISQQQRYLLNNYSFSQLFGSLNQNATLTYTNGTIPEPVTKYGLNSPDGMNVVMATLIGFGYRNNIQDVIIGTDKLSDQKNLVVAPLFTLGIRAFLSKDNQPVYTFAQTSVFGSLAAVYGNDTDLPDKIALINRPTMQIIIQEAVKLVNWFDKVSVPLYVDTFFKPYFAKENWKTSVIRFNNLEEMYSEAEIVYELYYRQPDTKKSLVYEVTLKRTAANGGSDGTWDTLGTWYIQKIDRK